MIRAMPRLLALALTLGAVTGSPAPVAAQDTPDFLFKRPLVSLTIRGGYSAPRAQSDLFDFTREQLCVRGCSRSLEAKDFGAPVIAAELAVRLNERVDVTLGGDVGSSRTRSETSAFIGTDGLPIEQTTHFGRASLTAGAKAYLIDRGRSVGNFAWIPARFSPYVGAGAGAVVYSFRQEGEFVDYQTYDIFRDEFVSDGWAPTAHVRGGMDLSLHPRVVLTGDARYSWGKAELSRDFVDFDDIDLAGFQATFGFSFRF
jgi:hypothetical protein